MSDKSAGILPYRFVENRLEIMLVHPGGPFWEKRDAGAWSIPKGLYQQHEDPLEAALREFNEETGFEARGDFIDLGELRQPSSKIVHAWAVRMDLDASKIVSNTFTLEWPRNSGRYREYPEVDRAEWFGVDEAKRRILKGQAPFLERLVDALRSGHPGLYRTDRP